MNPQDITPNASEEIISQSELTVRCSCSNCDYHTCFVKRQYPPCLSETTSKTCLSVSAAQKTGNNIDSLNNKGLQVKFKTELEDEMINTYKTDTVTGSTVSNPKQHLAEMIKESVYTTDVIESVTITDTNKINLSRAKLSAQIMDVPYNDFEDSLSLYNAELLPDFPKMSLNEVIQKIKEVYKACSCKVCDCIVGKSQKKEICNCKPCDCDECNALNNRATISTSRIEFIKWSDMKSEIKDQCFCKPCECIECADTTSQPCACKPCQCIECKPRKHYKSLTLVVAAVGDDNQTHQLCQCSPCDCIECSHRFGIASNTERHEMSTGLNRHPQCHCETCLNEACLPDDNDTCRCERHDKVMRKPVQRDNEYDVRNANVTYNKPYGNKSRHDIVTINTAITNNYSKTRKCNCDQCECLDCHNANSNLIEVRDRKFINVSNNFNNTTCDCLSCECEFCTRTNNIPNKLSVLKLTESMSCNCEECDCLNCNRKQSGLRKNSAPIALNKLFAKTKCECSICECTNCDRRMTTCSEVICDCSYCQCEYCASKVNISGNVNKLKGEILVPGTIHRKIFETSEQTTKTDKAKETLNCVQSTKALEYIRPNTLFNIEATNIKKSCKNCHLKDSFESLSNQSQSACLDTEHKTMSCESFSNFSIRNYSNYLGQFPNTPAGTCLSEVMNLNIIDHDFNLNTLDIPFEQKSFQKTLNISTNFYNNEHVSNSKYNSVIDVNCKKIKSTSSFDKNSSNSYNNNSFQATQKQFNNQCCIFEGENNLITQRSEVSKIDFTHDEDYKRAQLTLANARKYSQQLLELLESYEKANREFKSVFKKLEHDPVAVDKYKDDILDNTCKLTSESKTNIVQKTKFLDDVPERDENIILKIENINENTFFKDTNKKESKQILNTNENQLQSSSISSISIAPVQEKNRKELDYTNSKQKVLEHTSSKSSKSLDIDLKGSTIEYEMDLIPISEDNELSNESQPTISNKQLKRFVKKGKRTMILPKSNKKLTKLNQIFTDATNKSISLEEDKENNECQKLHENHLVYNSDFIEINRPIEIINSNTHISSHETKTSFKSNTTDTEGNILEHKSIVALKMPIDSKLKEASERLPFNKKKYCFNTENAVSSERPCIRQIQTQINEDDKLKTFQITKDYGSSDNISNNNDAMKVSLLTVQKVSDHTILVKWKAPESLKSVQGYELLVDGRAVQKILNVSRCMAVVTCVPNTEKILLTVRTVMNTKNSSDCSPSVTVIYKPRSSRFL